jgi:hypothetical protein
MRTMFFRLLSSVVLLLSFAAPTFAGPTTRPLAVWYQSKGDLPKWKARGVTLLIGYESEGGAVSIDDWCKTASDLGMDYVLLAFHSDGTDAGTSTHWNDVHCVAVGLSDEPNQLNASKRPPAIIRQDVAKIRSKCNKPVFLNLDGPQLTQETAVEIWDYVQAADWICFDQYSINNGYGLDQWNSDVTRTALMLKAMCSSTNKRLLVAVECSDQDLRKQGWIQQYPQVRDKMRGPNIDEFLKEYTDVLSWGATPMLFPDVIGQGFESRDGTPDVIDAALKALQARP